MSLCEDGPAGIFFFSVLSIVIFLQIQKIKRDGTSPLRSVVAGSGGRQSAGCLTLNVDTVLLLLISTSMKIIVLISTFMMIIMFLSLTCTEIFIYDESSLMIVRL